MGEQHFARSLNRMVAVTPEMRARYLDLQSEHRSGIWEWPCGPNALGWLEDNAIMQDFVQLECWLVQVLGALKNSAQIASNACYFATQQAKEGTTTVVAMETQSSKTHTYRIADGNQDAPALSYGADGKAYLTDGDIIAYLATKLSSFYTGIKRSNSTIAAEIALKKAHQRIEQVLNPAPIDYTFKEVKVNSDLPVMVAL